MVVSTGWRTIVFKAQKTFLLPGKLSNFVSSYTSSFPMFDLFLSFPTFFPFLSFPFLHISFPPFPFSYVSFYFFPSCFPGNFEHFSCLPSSAATTLLRVLSPDCLFHLAVLSCTHLTLLRAYFHHKCLCQVAR